MGVVWLPWGLIRSYWKRPRRIDEETYKKARVVLNERATALLEVGLAMKDRKGGFFSRNRRDRLQHNKFRQAVFLLETDFEKTQEAYQPKYYLGKIILIYLKLACGVLGIGISVCIILQILLYVIPKYTLRISAWAPFLNGVLTSLDSAAGFLGTAFYGIISFYFLLCVMHGQFTFGMRFFLFPLHPMKVHKTYMNSFLFNCQLLLMSAMAVVQFATLMFQEYARGSGAEEIFAIGVSNLYGLKYVYYAYIYGILLMVLICVIYQAMRPEPKREVWGKQ
jgi:LMBR1 domain-containing protein 1